MRCIIDFAFVHGNNKRKPRLIQSKSHWILVRNLWTVSIKCGLTFMTIVSGRKGCLACPFLLYKLMCEVLLPVVIVFLPVVFYKSVVISWKHFILRGLTCLHYLVYREAHCLSIPPGNRYRLCLQQLNQVRIRSGQPCQIHLNRCDRPDFNTAHLDLSTWVAKWQPS